MPTDASDTVKTDVLYPDELPGDGLEIDADRLNGGLAFYEAGPDGDDDDVLPDGASYGWWLPVVHPRHGAVWAAAPRTLREWLVENDLGPGDAFEVYTVERGPEDHDPYEFECGEYPAET